LLALLYAIGQWAGGLIWRSGRPVRSRWYAWAALASLAGTLLNPYGLSLHRHVAGYLTDSELLSRVGEFQSFNFHAAGSGWVLATVGIAGIGAAMALGNRRLDHFLVSSFFIAVALRSARGLPIVALCALPLANANIEGAVRRAEGLAAGVRRRIDAALDYSARLRDIDRGLAGWALVPLVLLAFVFIARGAQAGFPAGQFPVAASAVVAQLPSDARVFAPDNFGGYLIYRFNGQRKVFFDGRSDFYGAGFMKQYLRLVEARPGWQQIASPYHFTHALLPNDNSLAAALTAAGWKAIHKDSTATLLAAPQP
jgi:hypothetical protein